MPVLHTNSKGFLRVDGMRKKLCDEMVCFGLMHVQRSLICPFWVACFIKGQVKQTCFNLYEAILKATTFDTQACHWTWVQKFIPTFCWILQSMEKIVSTFKTTLLETLKPLILFGKLRLYRRVVNSLPWKQVFTQHRMFNVQFQCSSLI